MTVDFTQQFEAFYRDFGKADLTALADIYHPLVVFQDPVHAVDGIAALRGYFESSRANLRHCSFDFNHRAIQDDTGFFQWRMDYAHPRIQRGKTQCLRGCTLIRARRNKIVYHEDFYDLGAMLYEHVPVLGWAIRKIKLRIANG